MESALSRLSLIARLGIICAFVVLVMFSFSRPQAEAANSVALGGYAWSDTIGWISMSGSNYGLTMDQNGTVSGYAWSDAIGWVSANSSDIAACQSGATSRVQSGIWNGWLRAIVGGQGGWDGCISMSGSGYSVTYNKQSGIFAGYAWGDKSVGWVDFSRVLTAGASCQNLIGDNYCTGSNIYEHDVQGNACFVSTCAYQCSAGSCVAPPQAQPGFSDGTSLHIAPEIVSPGKTTTVSWNVKDVKNTCTVSGTNGDAWQSTADQAGNSSGSSVSSPIEQQVTYTLSCTGLDDVPYTEIHAVNIIPKFREI